MAFRRPGRFSAGRLLFALLVLAAASCARKAPTFPGAPVVLISIDTLRADHVPAYGYRAVSTPALDALASDAIVFENAIAHVPLTLPSHVSVFTGLLPFANGVRDNLGYRLDPARPTLAAWLSARGYATGAAVSAIVLDHGSGVARGFDFYDDRIESSETGQSIGQVQRPGLETEGRLEAWLSQDRGRRPVFAFLHLYEPHSPYAPPEPFRTRYAANPYDGEIAAADDVVGRFLGFLKAHDLYDRALVVFFSDHGEGLGDHGEDEHGILLYREEIHVPLFVKLPGGRSKGTRVPAPVALIDVFPTVAAALGASPPAGLTGVPLLDAAEGKTSRRRVYSETLYPRFHFGWSDLASLTDAGHQYIEAPRPELYDWVRDPAEKTDLAPSLSADFRRLRVELSGMSRPLQPPGTSDPETVKKLASLGYIGQASPGGSETNLPDPKDRIGTLRTLKDANRLAASHRDEEAIALLRRFASENPKMLDAWESLARLLRLAGRPAEAIDALERADRLAPGTPQIVMGLSDLSLEARDFEKAAAFARAAQALGSSGVDEQLGAIALARGDLAEAQRRGDAAHAANPEARVPLLLLGRVAARRGDYAGAVARLDEALEIEGRTHAAPIDGVRALRADALAHLGREKEAEDDFRRATRDFPESLDTWSRLALLYASAGRIAEFDALLTEMTTRVPTPRGFETAAKVCEIVGDHERARAWRAREKHPVAAGPS